MASNFATLPMDDWQAIYGFRNANPKYLIEFQKLYPNAQVVKLEQNYRSTQVIVEASNAVIKKNTVRTDKTMFSKNAYGDPILVHESDDQDTEARWIAQEIRIMHKQKVPLNEIAILYRTNAQSRALEDQFLGMGIPYKVIGGTSFYDRKEIKDVLCYVKTFINPRDEISFRRLIGLQTGIGKKTQNDIVINSKSNSLGFVDSLSSYLATCNNKKVTIALTQVSDIFVGWSQVNPDFVKLINDILVRTGYLKALKDEDTDEARIRIENLEEFKTIAAEFQREHPSGTLQQFIDKVSLSSTSDNGTEHDKLSLMTLHGAKGLEYPYVFLPGIEENILPHRNSFASLDAIEEERRLFYVGLTRAKKQVYLTNARRRYSYEGEAARNPVSRFLKDIPSKYLLEM